MLNCDWYFIHFRGKPLVVKATMCWKVEWDELEANQQNFLSLCSQLNKQVLSCLMDVSDII